MRALLPFIACSILLGCADGAIESFGEADGPTTALVELDSKADSTSELRVRAGQMTVWIDAIALTDHTGPTNQRIVISGRASRDLESVSSWVPDDAFGEARVISKRKFEVVLDEGHELNTALSGAPLYLSLRAKTGTPRDYYVRLALEPRFAKFEGSRQIWIRDAVLPVFVRDGRHDLRYRGLVTIPAEPTSLHVTNDDDSEPEVRGVDPTHFELDWSYESLILAMTPSTDYLSFSAAWGEAPAPTRHEKKRARLLPAVVKVAMSTEDPYVSFVLERTCDDVVRSCIAGANGADDLGACGTYRDVQICLAMGPICGDDSPDLELFPVASPELADTIARFSEACPSGGSWCSLDTIADFRSPQCLEALPDVSGLASMLGNLEAYAGPWSAELLTREELLLRSPFAMTDAGPSLLGTLGGWVGSMQGVYWLGLGESTCHNCHEWQVLLVAYFPDAGRVIAITGSYGWDS